MPKKVRELKAMLKKAGFNLEKGRGKGSHTVWSHPNYDRKVILSGKDGKDAGRYQERDIKEAIKAIQEQS